MNIKQLTAMAAMALATATTSSAYAHAKLEASSPKAGAVATPAPKEVWLRFNEPLELAFSKIQLLDAKGVAIGPLKHVGDKSNPKAMGAALPPLPPGEYRVQWTTLTRDGHKVKGEYAFQVK